MKCIITPKRMEGYRTYLYQEEKSGSTIEKYLSDLKKLVTYAAGREITKELMICYKNFLKNEKNYKISSINSYLVAANGFFEYMGWYGLKVKTFRVQKKVFVPEEKVLTQKEFAKLVQAARSTGKMRLAMVLQTICATGMRVSELQFVTVESLRKGVVTIYNKGKERTILIPKSLQYRLLAYIHENAIRTGIIFCTSGGRPLDRTYIWREMKKLCLLTGVEADKVFPHNLRALFARTYYVLFKDIAKLADLLGHSNIETTRIYIKSSGVEHRRQLDSMGLLENL